MKIALENAENAYFPALVVQAARFGDLVQTGRLIRSLAACGETHICMDHSLREIADFLYPRAILHGMNFHQPLIMERLEENRICMVELSGLTFGRIYNCNFSPLSTALCRIFPQRKVLGYRSSQHADGGIWRSEWQRLLFRITRSRKFASINLVDCWAWMCSDPIPSNQVNPVAKPGGKGLGLVLSGRMSRRSLPPETLAPIAAICFKALRASSLRLFGLASDQANARKLMRNLPPAVQARTTDLTGRTNWRQLKEELEGLDLLLTPDTGTMHLACALGVPVMAFFLSSAWCHETGPYGEGHFIWQSSLECAPCLENAACPNNVKCLEAFSNPGFGRALVNALEKGRADCPPGLQLWRTGFDRLGQKLLLRGGEDRLKTGREAARALVGAWLELETLDRLTDFSPDLLDSLASDLFPAQEWMLPPGRYC